MKTKFHLVCTLLYLSFSQFLFSQVPISNFRPVNFESGGYVTAVYPVNHSPSNIDNQVIYAKTDVGGVYRSANNGSTWGQVACYFNGGSEQNAYMMFGEYIIAGLAVHPTNPDKFVVAWGGFTEPDAIVKEYQCLWKTTDAGMTFSQPVITYDPVGDGVHFNGDDLSRKVGGESIIYSLRNASNMYMGGIHRGSNLPKIFISTDEGSTWNVMPNVQNGLPNSVAGESVLCLAMHKDMDELWVGTTHGIYRSSDLSTFTKISSIPNVRRILLTKNGNDVFAYVAGGSGNGSVHRFINSSVDNSLSTFPGFSTSGDNYTCLLAWLDDAQTKLIAGRWNRPTARLDALNSTSWTFDQSNQSYFFYNQSAAYPNHQFPTEITDDQFIYTGINSLVRNPNNSFKNYWYMSGGAGLRISGNIPLTSNYSFVNKKFHYSVLNQSMTVVNDIAFDPYNSATSTIYMPHADWTAGYTTDFYNYHNLSYPANRLTYDNQITRFYNPPPVNQFENTTVGYVSRSLFKQSETSRTYHLGANQYMKGVIPDKITCSMFIKKVNAFPNPPTVTNRYYSDGSVDDVYKKPDRFFADAVLYNTTSHVNNLITLVGKTVDPPGSPSQSEILGIFRSTNEGASFSYPNFDLPINSETVTTEQLYNNSAMPSLFESGTASSTPIWFQSQHNLASRNDNQFMYLYLPKLPVANEGGGVFMSSNAGQNWSGDIIPNTILGYGERFEGCLKYPSDSRLVLAVKNSGLYRGNVTTSDGSVSWSRINYFSSAEQVDVSGNQWAVFGIEAGNPNIKAPRLYKGIEDGSGNITWSLLQGRVRGVRALKFHPYLNSQLWVATSGTGVLILPSFADNINPPPIVVNNTYNVTESSYFDQDIIVENEGQLIIDGSNHPFNNIFMEMGKDRKITVEPGGKLIANNVIFQTRDNNKWHGIEFQDVHESIEITNCTFKNFETGLKIVNSNMEFGNKPVRIINNEFHIGQSAKGIDATNLFDAYFTNNQFISTQTSANIGIFVKNFITESNSGGVSASGGEETGYWNVVLYDNNFTNLGLSFYLGSEAANSYMKSHISKCTINTMSTCFALRRNIGTFANNLVSTSSNSNSSSFFNCDMRILNNYFSSTSQSSSRSDMLLYQSYLNISPYKNQDGSLTWLGGRSKFNSVNGRNLSFSGGYAHINLGKNDFNTGNNSNDFHLYGSLNDSISANLQRNFQALDNCWSGGIPKAYLYNSTNNNITVSYVPISNDCNQSLSQIDHIVEIIPGLVYDTIYKSDDVSGYVLEDDESLLSQIYEAIEQERHLDVVSYSKSLIETYPLSINSETCLNDMFNAYCMLDTSGDQSQTDILFADLKQFLEDKILSGNHSKDFDLAAYDITLYCALYLSDPEYTLDGYEFISLYHPNPEIQLLASYDYSELYDLIHGSGGSGGSVNLHSSILSKLKKFDKLSDKNPVMKKMRSTYDELSTKNESGRLEINKVDSESKDKSNKRKRSVTDLFDKEISRRALENLITLKYMDRESRSEKKLKDIMFIIGKRESLTDTEESILPDVFALHQNFPNPFNPTTKISFNLPVTSNVTIKIFDVTGREIYTLTNSEELKTGYHILTFNGSQIASGVYFYRIEATGVNGQKFVQSKKMVLIK